MKKLYLFLLILVVYPQIAFGAVPFATESKTVGVAPVVITDALCRVGGQATGAIVEVTSGAINYSLDNVATTPDTTFHLLTIGGVLELAEPYRFRAVRNGGSDATIRITCVEDIQETKVFKLPIAGGAASNVQVTDGVDTAQVTTTAGGSLQVECTGGCAGGVQYNQGTAAGPTDSLTMGGAIRRDTAGLDAGVVDGDRAALSVDASGRLRTTSADTTQPVSGTVGVSGSVAVTGPLTDTQLRATPVPVSGTVTVTDGAGALNVVVDSGAVTVSGTVTANAGTGTFTVGDGGGSLTVDAPVGTPVNTQISDGTRTATVRDTGTSDSLNVAIVDAAGAQITTFGGGAQYTEGDVDATITGTAMMGEVATNTLQPLQLNANKQLIVDLGTRLDQTNDAVSVYGSDDAGTTKRIIKTDSGGAVQVDVESGTITANQGGTWNINNVSGTVSLPTGAATSALQDGIIKDGTGDTTQANVSGGRVHVDGSGVTQPVSGSVSITQGGNTAAVNASSQLSVNCANCTGSGVSHQDKTGFTAGTSNMVPIGGYMDDATPSTLAEGEAGAARMTTNRAVHVNLRDASGTELSVGGGTQYDQGTATTATDKLTMSGAIRRDTASLDAGVADGDRAALSTDSVGRLRTNPSASVTGTLQSAATANGNGTALSVDGMGSTILTVNCAACSGGTLINFEGTEDNTNYTDMFGYRLGQNQLWSNTTTTSGITHWQFSLSGLTAIRARISSYSAGTVTVTAHAVPSVGAQSVQSFQGGLWQVTANVGTSGPSTGKAEDLPHATGDTGIAVWAVRNDSLGTTFTTTNGDYSPISVDATGAVRVDPSGTTTQPISAASLPLPTGAATAANQDGIIRDGTGDTTQANVSTGRLHVDGSGVTQPVSGTVTANAGTGTFFDGIIRDGTGDTTQANVTGGNLSVTCANCSGSGAVHTDDATFTGATDDVAPAGFLYDTSPPTITDGRAGIARMNANRQIYVDLATRLDPTNDEVKVSGTAADGAAVSGNPVRVAGKDGSGNTQDLATDTGGILSVNVQNTPTVTANAGTNLNTSALLTNAAHDNAFGTAGTADAQVRSVQGIAGMTPIVTSGANANPKINCTNNAFLNMTSATTTEIVALSGSTIIYVCSFSIVSNGGTATNVKFVDGTGTNCATSQSDRSANMPFTAATNTVGISRGSGEGMILKTSTAGDALCVTSSGAATIAVDVSYAQF